MRDDAFTRLRLKRLVSLIHRDNTASIRVALKLGERFDRPIELPGRTMPLYSVATE